MNLKLFFSCKYYVVIMKDVTGRSYFLGSWSKRQTAINKGCDEQARTSNKYRYEVIEFKLNSTYSRSVASGI